MGIKEWAVGQRLLGNPEAAVAGEGLLRKYGDISTNPDGTVRHEPYESTSVSQLVRDEREKLEDFFRQIIEVPEPTLALLKKLEIGNRLGFSFEPHYLPPIELGPDREMPSWKVRPKDRFWELVSQIGLPTLGRGMTSTLHTGLIGGWMLVENIVIDSQEGHEPYAEDPVGAILEDLRGRRKIYPRYLRALDTVIFPKSGQQDRMELRNLPKNSRFGVAASDELENWINFKVQSLFWDTKQGDDEGNVTQPTPLEFNILGNLHHPEWGDADTTEWLWTQLQQGARYFGGNSSHGGLADIDRQTEAISRRTNRGFRFVLRF